MEGNHTSSRKTRLEISRLIDSASAFKRAAHGGRVPGLHEKWAGRSVHYFVVLRAFTCHKRDACSRGIYKSYMQNTNLLIAYPRQPCQVLPGGLYVHPSFCKLRHSAEPLPSDAASCPEPPAGVRGACIYTNHHDDVPSYNIMREH